MKSKVHTSSVLSPQAVISNDIDTGIVRLTGNAKLKPWMQILHANLPVGKEVNNDVLFLTVKEVPKNTKCKTKMTPFDLFQLNIK